MIVNNNVSNNVFSHSCQLNQIKKEGGKAARPHL
jgi:hypothetical protein